MNYKNEEEKQKQEVNIVEITCNANSIILNNPAKNEDLVDSATTNYFIIPDVPINNIIEAENPIKINMPNSIIEKSTHMCTLRITGLP